MNVRPGGAILVVAALTTPALAGPDEAAATSEAAPAPPAQGAPATPDPGVGAPVPMAAPPATDQPAPKFTWEPFGYLRLQYLVVQNDPNVAFVGRDDGFELQNARLGVRGQLAGKLSYVVAIDGAVDERTQINTPEGKLKVALKDAYVDTSLPAQLTVRAGFFATLVDPNLDGDTVRELVDRPLESRGMRATEGYQTHGLPPGRSLGAALRLDPGPVSTGVKVGFELAVQNGADEYASNNDNDTPAASASLLVRLPQQGYLVASGRFNRRTEGDLPFRQDEDDLQGSIGARVAAGPVVLGAGAVVQHTTFPTTGGPAENGYGAHAQLMVKLGAALPVFAGYRFGILDPSSLILTDRVIEHTAGVVLGVPGYRMRVQLQVTHVSEQAARTLANDRVQLAAEVSL